MLKNYTHAKLQLSASLPDAVVLCHCCIAGSAAALPVPRTPRAGGTCHC